MANKGAVTPNVLLNFDFYFILQLLLQIFQINIVDCHNYFHDHYYNCYYFHLARHNLLIYQPPPTQLAKRSRRQCSTSLIGRQNTFIEQISRRCTSKFCEVLGINPYKNFSDLVVVVFLSTVAFAINLSNISFLAFQRNFLTYLQV